MLALIFGSDVDDLWQAKLLWQVPKNKIKNTKSHLHVSMIYWYSIYTQSFKSLGVCKNFYFLINTFIQQGCIEGIKSDSKEICYKIFLTLFKLSIKSKNSKIKTNHDFHKISLSTTTFILFSMTFLKQQISILEWFNDAENSALLSQE